MKSTITLSIPFQIDIDNIGFVEDETDDLTDEINYLFSVNINYIIVDNTMINFSEKTIDRPSIIETPPPKFE